MYFLGHQDAGCCCKSLRYFMVTVSWVGGVQFVLSKRIHGPLVHVVRPCDDLHEQCGESNPI